MAHAQTWVKINAPVDAALDELMCVLSTFPRLQTIESCQGNRTRPAWVCFSYGNSWEHPWRELASLVENAFRRIKRPFTVIETGGRNQPRHDLLVEDYKLSIKTETGYGTSVTHITITKLCTTEREPWAAEALVERVMEHLARYDLVVMLRAVWKRPLIHY